MKYRKLGKTDLKVSQISIGCSGYWGKRNFSENKAESIIHEAYDRGVNFFDTGHHYCNFNAEPRLGRIVKNILSSNDRSSLIISSKAGAVKSVAPIYSVLKGKQLKDFSPDAIEKSCFQSIRNLNCGYLDIFQLHGITKSQITEPLIQRLLDMKEKGMFRYLGAYTHRQSDMLFISKNSELFDMVLTDYNVLQLDREPIINELVKSGVGVVAGTVLAQGHLVKGKIGSLKSMPDIWYLARALLKPTGRLLSRNSKRMRDTLLLSNEMTGAQAAFAYILENLNISSCIFGTTSIPNLLEIIEAADKTLEDNCKAAIRTTFNELTQIISE